MNPLEPFRAVCFDLDGTLVDSYDAITASINHVRSLHGQPPLNVAAVKRNVGRGAEYLLQHTVPGYQGDADQRAYAIHHPRAMLEKTFLLPGALAALQALHEQKKRLALCSNKPRVFTDSLLPHLRIAEFFAAVMGPEDVPRLKPAPDMLVEAMRRLGVPREQTLYIGDMVVDVQAGRAAGTTVWVVPTGSDEADALKAAAPDRFLVDLSQMANLSEPEA